jgi:starvation-inducible outer membrane lipoprotein
MVTLVSLGLAACVTPPSPYVPYECKGQRKRCVGYSQVKLAPDIYQVRFEGAASADTWARIEDYTLLRCAELTLAAASSRPNVSSPQRD